MPTLLIRTLRCPLLLRKMARSESGRQTPQTLYKTVVSNFRIMPIEGGRLNAHKARMKDFRIRKERKAENKKSLNRFEKEGKIEFDKIDPAITEKTILEIRRKGKIAKRKNLILILISVIIAIGIGIFIGKKYI